MNQYRIFLTDGYGCHQHDHIMARSAQEAADIIRREWKSCYVIRIALEVNDWK